MRGVPLSAARRNNEEDDLLSRPAFFFLVVEGAELAVYDIRSAEPNEFRNPAFGTCEETGEGWKIRDDDLRLDLFVAFIALLLASSKARAAGVKDADLS